MDGIIFDPTEFISSPFFWRALLLLFAMWLLKNARSVFDSLKYVVDRLAETWRLRAQNTGHVDRVVADILRDKTQNGSRFDASFAVTLQQSIIDEKDAEIAELKTKLSLAEQRNHGLTNLAIEKSEESARVILLLNGTVAVFNTIAERLSDAVEQLVITLKRGDASGESATN